ncbi:MAG: hypothetical protein FJ291_32245 [Planctomycetes bacterium]|nr:hypothetical protein [Planctomycetota bacterium]
MSAVPALCERYLRDREPVRMGNLASDLMRLSQWAAGRWKDERIVELMETIAWMLEQNPEFASEELANMQREICHWRRIWPVEAARPLLAFRARLMSERILELSGLLDEGACPEPQPSDGADGSDRWDRSVG